MLDPKSAPAYYILRGRLYGAKEDYARAITDFDQAIALDPKSSDAYYQRGLAKRERGDLSGAIGDFDPVSPRRV